MKKLTLPALLAFIVALSSCGSKEETLMQKACELRKIQTEKFAAKDNDDDKKVEELEEKEKNLRREVEDLGEEITKKRDAMSKNEMEEYEKKWKDKFNDFDKKCAREVEDLRDELKKKK